MQREQKQTSSPPLLHKTFLFSHLSSILFCQQKEKRNSCSSFAQACSDCCVWVPILIPPWSGRIELFRGICVSHTSLLLCHLDCKPFSTLSLDVLLLFVIMLRGHGFSHYMLCYCQAVLLHSIQSDLTQLWLIRPA